MARDIRRACSACGSALLAIALAGCSGALFGPYEEKPVDPNIYPSNHKTELVRYMETNPTGYENTRETFFAPPTLKMIGTQNRYVACLRVVGPDWRKEKMLIYFGGELNQFVDATSDMCGGAAYQPFPELTATLSRFGMKR